MKRCKFAFLKQCMFVSLSFIFLAQSSAGLMAQAPAGAENALRKRVGEFYALMKLKKATEAEKYVTAETLDQFRLMPNGEFLNAEISSIEWNADKSAAAVMINIMVSSATIPVPFSLPRKTDWKLTSDGWQIVIPPQASMPSGGEQMFPGHGESVAPAKTDLEFPHPIVDLTPIRQGEKKSVSFSFTNTSQHPVTVTDVKSDCKCIVLKSVKKTYKPGEKGELVFEFDSSDFSYEYRQSIAVFTNPEDQRVNLMLSASISPRH